MKTRLALLVILLSLSGCNVTDNLSDGYHQGDVRDGLERNYESYCSAVYVPIRTVGRWMLRLIAYPVPDLCINQTEAN